MRARPSIEPFFVGARRGIERDVLPTTEFPHVLLDLHPLYRSAVWKNWKTVVGAVERVAADRRDWCAQQRPALVVGTGGYAAGIMLAYGVVHRIPHRAAGRRQLSRAHGARRSAGGRVRFISTFPKRRGVLKAHHAGIADRHRRADRAAAVAAPGPSRGARARGDFPTTGGHVLLDLRREPGLAGDQSRRGRVDRARACRTICTSSGGPGAATYEQFKHLDSAARARARLSLADRRRLCRDATSRSSRAGAMTTAELFAWGIPAVLVPLPTAAADHQTTNAVTLERAGAAVNIPQSQLTDRSARRDDAPAARRRRGARARCAAARAARARPDAAEEIARRILALDRRHASRR